MEKLEKSYENLIRSVVNSISGNHEKGSPQAKFGEKLLKSYENKMKIHTEDVDAYWNFLKEFKSLLEKNDVYSGDIEKLINEANSDRIEIMVGQQKMAGNDNREIQENCEIAQVAITADMKKALGRNLDLQGLKFATKSFESLNRKINDGYASLSESERRSKYKDDIRNFVRDTIKDSIRYTADTTMGSMYDDWERIMLSLKKMGYKCIKIGNYWLNENSSYKGVNMAFSSPYGYSIEIQFHTPEDKKAWVVTHRFYEEQRKKDTSPKLKKFLSDLQKRKIQRVLNGKVPENIELISLDQAIKLGCM